MLTALIDSDILVYRVGFTTEEESQDIAKYRMQESINGILQSLHTDDYACFLTSTDKSNFRYKIYPEYKANRKQPKPYHYDFLRNYLVESHEATIVTGMEADDALGIAQDTNTVICSIDKDLDQIPGKHYNFVKGLLYDVDELGAERAFYVQLLTGDRGDNIPGLYGIGPKTAERILNGYTKPIELWNAVYSEYKNPKYKSDQGEPYEIARRNGQLLRIRRDIGEGLWEPPTEGVTQ